MARETNHRNLKILRFQGFSFNPATGELERGGVSIPLQNTPARLLTELAGSAGELLTREELCARLWPRGVFVDFENNLNNAIARLRKALGADGDRYIETVPRRGYRFRSAVERDSGRLPLSGDALRKAWTYRERTTSRDLWRAVEYFREAIEWRPDSAGAYAGISDAYVLLGDDVLGGMPGAEALPVAEKYAHRALAIDPRCPLAHTTLAMADWRLRWDWQSAENRFREALAYDPRNATALQYYSWMLQGAGRGRESREAILAALANAPGSRFIGSNVGWMLYLDRRYREALTQLRQTLQLDPSYALVRLPLGYALQASGRVKEAIGHFRTGFTQSGDAYYHAALGQALGSAGFQRQASRMLTAAPAFNRAMIHASMGQQDEAVACLEFAAAERSSAVPYLRVDPIFDRVRNHSRYREIADRVCG